MLTRDHFATLPIEVRHERSWALGRFFQFVVLVFAGIFAATSYLDGDKDSAILGAGAGLGGIVLLEVLLRVLGRYKKLGFTVDRTGVARTRGKDRWTEPLDAYEGVMWREQIRRSKNSSHRVYFLDLKHARDPDRTVPLLFRRTEKGLRGCWEGAAAALGLPALRELDNGEVLRREAADVDKSLRDLAREGRREVPEDSFTLPPEDVAWSAAAPLSATVRPPEIVWRGAFYISLAIPVLGAIVALIEWTPWPLLTLVAPLAAYVWRQHANHLVALADGRLRVAARIGGTTYARTEFPVDDVEQVRKEQRGGFGTALDLSAVVIESDRAERRIPLLASDAADWIYRFIHVLVIEADDAA
ncbi:MAG: hypothetical protein RIM84_26000 [Alphaproteobacteria bacterium]